MGKLPIKKTRKLAEAAEVGRLTAERKFRKKESLQERALRYFEKFMDKMQIDPIELMAILGGTVLVHDVIFALPEFVGEIKKVASTAEGGVMEKTLATWFKYFSLQIPTFQVEAGFTVPEVYKWLTAFCISYMGVKHGFDLLTIAKGMFGVGKL